MEPRVGNKFRLDRKTGSGSFGKIYLGTNIQTQMKKWLLSLFNFDHELFEYQVFAEIIHDFSRSLIRCLQEMRMKGASFDLSKEPLNAKRMKSSSVEIKWKPLTWCSQSLKNICLLCLTGLLFPASRFILCI